MRIFQLWLLVMGLTVLVTASAATAQPATSQPTSAPTEQAEGLFMIVEGEGLFVRLDGTVIERFPLAVAPGATVYAPAEGAVYVLDEPDLSVSRIDLGARSGTLIARMRTPEGCSESMQPLGLQGRDDLGIAADGGLCVRLMDRNINMMNVSAWYRISLPGGATRSWIDVDLEGDCTATPTEATCPIDDAASARPAGPPVPTGTTIDETSCVLTLADGRTVPLPLEHDCWPLLHTGSRDGRYLIVTNLADSGDYIYHDLHVIDVREAQRVESLASTVVGETRLHWSTDGQHLLVGDSLYILDDAPRRVAVPESAVFVSLPR